MPSHLFTPRSYTSSSCDYFHCGISWWIVSAVFLALFGLLFFIHLGLAIKSKHHFVSILVIAVFLETAGYAIKLAGAWFYRGDTAAGLFIAWHIILMSAPFFVRTFIYILLNRLHAHFTPSTPLLRSGHLILPILPYFDIFPFILQLFGLLTLHGVLPQRYTPSTPNAGTLVLFASFILQYIPLLFFFACLVAFHKKANKARRNGAFIITISSSKYKGLLHAMYWTVICLLIRLTYYTYNAGSSATWLPLRTISQSHSRWERWQFKQVEFFSLIFDSFEMFVIVLTFAAAHPGRFLRKVDELPRTGWRYQWKVWRGGNAVLGGRTEEFRMDSEVHAQGQGRTGGFVA